MVMELLIDGMEYNPVDYNSYDEFWDELPKDGDFVDYYEFSNDFIEESGLDLDTPRTKDELKDVFEFMYSLNTSYDEEEDQEMIIHGIKLFASSTDWKTLAKECDTIFSAVEDSFITFTYDELEVVDAYLRDQGLYSAQIAGLINYINVDELIGDNFYENNNHYYIR